MPPNTPEELYAALAEPLASSFAAWAAAQPGLLERSTEQSVRDMAGAWFAGYRHGQKVMREFGRPQRPPFRPGFEPSMYGEGG